MTPAHLRCAALWLRAQAARTAAAQAAHLADRRHKPRRTVDLPRDVRGRWYATTRRAA